MSLPPLQHKYYMNIYKTYIFLNEQRRNHGSLWVMFLLNMLIEIRWWQPPIARRAQLPPGLADGNARTLTRVMVHSNLKW